jgi:hypothetical protein
MVNVCEVEVAVNVADRVCQVGATVGEFGIVARVRTIVVSCAA